jgi:hypothetical protein
VIHYVFLDIDLSLICFRVLSRKVYPTHVELYGTVVYYYPETKLDRRVRLGRVRVLAVDLERYTIAVFRSMLNTYFVVSGTLRPFKGYLTFIPGLPFSEVSRRLSSDKFEIYYREEYLKLLGGMEAFRDTVLRDLSKLNESLPRLSSSYSEIIKNLYDYIEKTLGFMARSPEAIASIENLIIASTAPAPPTPTPPPAPTPPSPPPRKSIWERIRGLFSWLKR